MIRGHPLWATCPACGSFKTEGMPCQKCGYTGLPIPARAIFHFPISQRQVPESMGGTLTFSASAAMAVDGLFHVEKEIMKSDLEPEEKIQLRSYVGLAQEIIIQRSKERKEEHPEHYTQFREKINEYRTMIENNKEESEFQAFFTNNPNFLVPVQMVTKSKPNYGGEFEPDFIIEASTGTHWIIEIETPSKLLFTKDNRPRSGFTQAEKQVREYLQWTRANIQFLKERDWPRLKQENIYGLLIIGNRSQLTPCQEAALEAMNHDRRSSYKIKTFDDVLKENEVLLDNWEKI